MGVAKQILF